jgi:carbamoyltransferase
MKKRNYIGLASSAHEPALAIVNSAGEVVFAESSERYLQNKRGWCSPPDDMIRVTELIEQYCESDVDLVVATSWEDSYVRKYRLLLHVPFIRPLLEWYFARREGGFGQAHFMAVRTILAYTDCFAGNNLELRFREMRPGSAFLRRSYEHHLAHAAAACYSSPFEEAVCLVVDGEGQDVSTGFYHFQDGRLKLLPVQRSTASLGIFYSKMCTICGFDLLRGEEWKMMGLGPYGKHDPELYELMRRTLHVENGTLRCGPDWQRYEGELWARLRRPDQSALEMADLAHTAQQYFSELLSQLLGHLHSLGISENLVLAGGCALNSAYNGRIHDYTSFQESFIFCAPADDGNAVGAAQLAYHQDHSGSYRARGPQTPYLGSTISDRSCERVLRYGNLNPRRIPDRQQLYSEVADLLANKKIVGWVQGRAEFGPRALGNRSILADPRDPGVKDRLNATVKFREEFRPFAPAILHEHGPDYFHNYRETPYMERALQFTEKGQANAPGVVHVDGTGRLQSVRKEWNTDYHGLLTAFYEQTGVPVLLNTSFNVMGKPIIHSMEDAISVYLFSGLDVLVVGDLVFQKDASGSQPCLAASEEASDEG